MATLASSPAGPVDREDGINLREERRVAMTEDAFMRLDGVHAEWVNGYALFMSPVSVERDDLRFWLGALLRDICEAKQIGKVHGEPFVTRLPSSQLRSPDLMFIATASLDRLEKNRLVGPPDALIEIVSPESVSRDYREKFAEYEAAGVREYWIVDPVSGRFEVHRLGADGRFQEVVGEAGRVRSAVVDGFFFDEVWLRAPLPRRFGVLREMGVSLE